jgi:competence protein ComEA
MLSRSDGRWALVVAVIALGVLGLGLLTRGPLPPDAWEGLDGAPSVGTLDLNRAGVPRLKDLPQVGPTLAQRIVRYRLVAGPYPSPDALRHVPGIGPETLQKLRPHLQTCGPLGCR